MIKTFRFSCCALLAACVFLSATSTTQAASSTSSRSKSLLKKIYKNSDEGDGGDIYDIIRDSLAQDPTDGEALVNRLIKALKKNRDQLAFDVSEDDLDRISKKLKKWIKRHPVIPANIPPGGPITPPESSTQNN